MVRIFFVGIAMVSVLGSLSGSGSASAQTRKPLAPGVVGVLPIDAATEYVFLDRPTTVGGVCKGWKAVSVQQPGQVSGSGMTGMVCWKESNGRLLTATASQVTSQLASMDLIR
ncbi:hypothetical protein VLK31_20075 [Variovorax sp. H27-G14]|uniref:hypothetical protein n=1 Tax=Variovorax sp. H27-G14 TaxID=3111914 RepID=UPI0038FCC17B